jgi:hypothetical protein
VEEFHAVYYQSLSETANENRMIADPHSVRDELDVFNLKVTADQFKFGQLQEDGDSPYFTTQ